MNKRFIFLTLVILAGFMLTLSGCGNDKQATYPHKAIDLIISWPAGGGSDLATRALAKEAEQYLGQPITPINIAGSNGAMAWAEAVKRKNDGYTIALFTFDILSNQALKTSSVKYNDFEYLLQFSEQPMAFMVNKDSDIKDLTGVIAAAKAKRLKMGTTPLGGVYHQAISLLEQTAGVTFDSVPFKGDSDELAALLGKHTDVQIMSLVPVEQYVKQGTVKLLAVTTDKRLEQYPEVPTLKELGYDVVYSSWRAIGIKKGAPPEVKAKLADAFKKSYDSHNFKEFAKRSKLDQRYRNTTEFDAYLQELHPKVEKVLTSMSVIK